MLERGNESELWHIGTATSGRYPKGSGARPYQHTGKGPSGTNYGSKKELTDNEKYIKELRDAVETKRLQNQYDKLYDPEGHQKDEQALSTLEKGINSFNQGLSQMYNQTAPRNEKEPLDYEKAKEIEDIADKELQQRINRLNMERQYLSLMQERDAKNYKIDKAKYAVHEFLGYAVPVATIVGAVAPTAIALYVQRHK